VLPRSLSASLVTRRHFGKILNMIFSTFFADQEVKFGIER